MKTAKQNTLTNLSQMEFFMLIIIQTLFNNPLNVNGLAQLDQSIYVLKGCWKVLFIFIHFNRMFCKQTVETMITLIVYIPKIER